VTPPKSSILVLIPAHNEERHIGPVVESLVRMNLQVWVLDDGSRDRTASVAEERGARVFRFPELKGKTARIKEILTVIPELTEWILCLDGDGQHDPSDFERFQEAASRADLVIGNRFHRPVGMPPLRYLANKGMSVALNLIGGGKHPDTQCGYRMIRRSWLGSWLPSGSQFEWESELYLQALRTGARICSVPVRCIYGREKSKISFWREMKHFLQLLWGSRKLGNT